MSGQRIAIPTHGHFAAMRYKFRCGIESKERGIFKKRICFRAVMEKHHMSWEDFFRGNWRETEAEAIAEGNALLDAIESPPVREYLTTGLGPEQKRGIE